MAILLHINSLFLVRRSERKSIYFTHLWQVCKGDRFHFFMFRISRRFEMSSRFHIKYREFI